MNISNVSSGAAHISRASIPVMPPQAVSSDVAATLLAARPSSTRNAEMAARQLSATTDSAGPLPGATPNGGFDTYA